MDFPILREVAAEVLAIFCAFHASVISFWMEKKTRLSSWPIRWHAAGGSRRRPRGEERGVCRRCVAEMSSEANGSLLYNDTFYSGDASGKVE